MGSDIPGKAEPRLVKDLQRHQCNAGSPLHVSRPAAIDAPVDYVSAVRVVRPVGVGVDRHCIDVAVEDEGLAATRTPASSDNIVTIAVAVLDRYVGWVSPEGFLIWCPGIDYDVKAPSSLFEPVGEGTFFAHHAGDANRLRHHLGQSLALGFGRGEKYLN
jgi:hypothetical protein